MGSQKSLNSSMKRTESNPVLMKQFSKSQLQVVPERKTGVPSRNAANASTASHNRKISAAESRN